MTTASLELCKQLWELSAWEDTTWHHWKGRLWTNGELRGQTMSMDSHNIPAYDADYLANRLQHYDFTIVNLNSEEFSLTSDSLDDPEAAILGRTLAELLCKLAIELFNQGVLKPESEG